jgi:SDR family mycofactocin-dependent oxidoreductase
LGLLDGRIAFVTGAARGQGRAHAVRLAAEGAAIVAVDAAGPVGDNGYPAATAEDLAETVRQVEALDRRIVARRADVRESAALDAVLDEAAAELGPRLDVVVANAGISNWNRFWEMSDEQWQTVLDVNLTGVWRTLKAAAPRMIAAGNGGSIVAISSVAGLKSLPAQAHYSAAKHGVVGLVGTAAIELAEYGIRVNSVHPWAVRTDMGRDRSLDPVLEARPDYRRSFVHLLPDRAADPGDIADAVLWLASDLSRTVTGANIPVDLGATTL